MCGIGGIINFNGQPVERADLKLMTDAIKHRGPDGEGFYIRENVGFGHRRLAIIDLSEAGAQPMTRFGCAITYNGEIYNYIEIRQELEKKGIVFTTRTDTEVILAAYHVWGKDCVQRFNGMWSFALHDLEKQQVFFSRDRFGEKPFYYTNQRGRFIFCSEIKGLKIFCDILKPDLGTVADFIVEGKAEHQTNTFFEKVYKIAPGYHAVLCLATRNFSQNRYYYPLGNLYPNRFWTEPEFQLAFGETLNCAVKLRLQSDVRVGTCLSGGIDSSSIAALAANIQGQSAFYSITIGNKHEALDDSPYAKMVAKRYALDWVHFTPQPNEFIEILSTVISQQEEPVDSPSVIMQHLVMRRASQSGIRVLLDGQGADELLMGYKRYIALLGKNLPVFDRANWFLKILRNSDLGNRELAMFLTYFQSEKLKQMRRWMRWHQSEGLWKAYLNFKQKNDLLSNIGVDDCVIENYRLKELTDLSLPSLLRYEDKNAMAYSIETRLPFLDPELVRLVLSIPISWLCKDGWLKYPLRKSMQPFLPAEVVWRRRKLGFEAPDELWLQALPSIMTNVKNSPLLNELGISKQKNWNSAVWWRLNAIAVWDSEWLKT